MTHWDWEDVIMALGKKKRGRQVLLILIYNLGKYFYVLLHVNLIIFLESCSEE